MEIMENRQMRRELFPPFRSDLYFHICINHAEQNVK